MNNSTQMVLRIIASYITTIVLAFVSGYGITGIDLLLPCVFVFVFLIYSYADRVGLHKDKVYGYIMGFIISLTYITGNHVTINDNERFVSSFTAADLFYVVVLSILFSAIIVIVLQALDKHKASNGGKNDAAQIDDRKYYILTFSTILICYLPYYMAMYPGNLGKDTFDSISMAMGLSPLNNHHPIFFTALIALVIRPLSNIMDLTTSMGVFSLLHMLVYIATLSYVQIWLRQRGANRILRVISLAFFSLHPFMAMYSIYITKDVWFSCVFVILVIKLYDLTGVGGYELRAKRNTWLLMSALLLLMLLLRNNAILICIGLMIALIMAYNDCRKYMYFSFIAVFILFGIIKGPICGSIGVEPSSFAEVASVPLQQIGYTMINNPDSIGYEDRIFLENILSADELNDVYTLGYTDPYKFHEEFDDELINSEKWRFLQIWARLLPANLSDYIKVYLAQTVGYWHYGTTNTVCTEGTTDNSLGIKQMGIPAARRLISELMLVARKAPLLCVLASMASQIAVTLLLAITYIRDHVNNHTTGRINRLIALLPAALLWISIMLATPAYCLFRYMYPLFIMWPITIKELLE